MSYAQKDKVLFYLRWECGQAVAKPPLKLLKFFSLNMLSLKLHNSLKNNLDT